MQIKLIGGLASLLLLSQANAQITFYEGEGFRGRTFYVSEVQDNFRNNGYNDLASSVIVTSGRWEVCDDAYFGGRCMVLRPGSYDTLERMGMNKRISSVRPLGDNRRYENESPAPLSAPNYEYRRRPGEGMYEAQVTSVREVVGPPSERCWIERQQVNQGRSEPNVGGAVAGALLGGILGHQVGGGTGRDLATVGGAVAGGAIGANVGRNDGNPVERDVRRCKTTTSTTPAYWDVTYIYRGIEHRVQMSYPPGATIAVNRSGEPRQ
ncbi:beta/gamma crystallin-related protein [Undibacterium sp. TS12]|uniref:beta/gamma crystallin-related protein n=1 Tax=Undibacterium sp. TS12 TaxID=2908202 RepID=UPI0024091FC9|nr:beta/gamma crystallin-related protein [Undibacterium sp. TS12]